MPDQRHTPLARLAFIIELIVEKVRGTRGKPHDDMPLVARLTAHLGIIGLVVFGLLASGVELRAAGTEIDISAGQAESDLPPILLGEETSSGNLTLSAIPITIVQKSAPRPRLEVLQYVVGPGDTVTGIAARFHVSADSILWANPKLEDNPDLLSIGQNLNIPPTSGVLYTVQQGDTVETIARRFKANPEDIVNDSFNQGNHDLKASPPNLKVGNFVMVPGGSKPFVVRTVTVTGTAPRAAARGTSNFVWPTRACFTQYFWSRHSGVDLAGPTGTSVYAADSGYIMVVGWDNTGYGNMILINHGNGYLTRYGHLSAFNVVAGQSVKKGDLIGRIGSTGHSTGPHLHFEIIQGGVPRNPLYYVKGKAPGKCAGY